MVQEHSLDVPGARLHYEVRGSGPLLLLIGAPMNNASFVPLADALAGDFTVVTTDPRGISKSPLDDPEQDSTPYLPADDIHRPITALAASLRTCSVRAAEPSPGSRWSPAAPVTSPRSWRTSRH
jgi:pimeloyl-ACP methyl ester carboxylesterase